MPIIQSIDRALKVLDLFDEFHRELKIAEICVKLDLHKSTVHSILKTLQMHNYIRQNPENGKYSLGFKLFERGDFLVNSMDLREIAKPYLLDLARATSRTVHLVILDGREGLYIDKVEGPSTDPVSYSRIGRRVPLHSSAVGKVLVAFKPVDEIRDILKDYDFKKQTERTILNEQELMSELQKVRQQGYAFDNQENETGIVCFALPIRNYTGDVVAAMSLSATASWMEEHWSRYVDLLEEKVSAISTALGYSVVTAANEAKI